MVETNAAKRIRQIQYYTKNPTYVVSGVSFICRYVYPSCPYVLLGFHKYSDHRHHTVHPLFLFHPCGWCRVLSSLVSFVQPPLEPYFTRPCVTLKPPLPRLMFTLSKTMIIRIITTPITHQNHFGNWLIFITAPYFV